MSALDRLENYHSSRVNDGGVFDTGTPEGAFLSLVHKRGLAMYDENKNFTELHDAICQSGNQKVQATAGSGKALVNGTGVITDFGICAVDMLKVGDKVMGVDGLFHTVLGVFPQGYKTVYNIRMSDGQTVSCCKEHLWGLSDGSVLKTIELKRGMRLAKFEPIQADSEVDVDLSSIQLDFSCSDTVHRYLEDSLPVRRYVLSLLKDLQESIPEMFVSDITELARSCGFVVYPRKSYKTILKWLKSGIRDTSLEVAGIKCSYERQQMTCISVDAPDQLFMLEGYIPTHNTTMLLHKIMHDIATGEIMCVKYLPNNTRVKVVDKVFVGTFLKSGADELRQRLNKLQRSMGYTVTADQINFGTLHAEFKRCLNAMNVATPIGSASVISGLLRKAVQACNITRDGSNLIAEDYKIIESIVTYYRGRLDDERYHHPEALEYGLTPSILDLLVKQFSELKSLEGVMDFDDLQELLYKYIYVTPNPAVQDFVAQRYNYMYLDEFQDTSQIQYALIKAYMRNSKGKIVVVGDVEQCIYSFRGSDINVMYEDFDKDFENTHSSLSYNYRCPANVLNPVIPSINRNPEAAGIDIKPYKQGGTFDVLGVMNYRQMLLTLMDNIESDISMGHSVAILCRTNYDGLLPSLFLEIQNKYDFSVSGGAMTLNSALPKKLIKVTSLFTDRGTKDLQNTIQMFVPPSRQYAIRQLMDVLKTNRLRLWEVPIEDLKYSLPDLVEPVRRILEYKQQGGDIEALKGIYGYLMLHVFDRDSTYCESARAIIEVLLLLLDSRTFESIADFREEVELLDERLNGRVGAKKTITVATVHEYKGKESDCVYVWNDSEYVFPPNKTDLNDQKQVSEERRVHYIACTRAKEKSIILCKATSPSMFLQEMDADMKRVMPEINGSLRGA